MESFELEYRAIYKSPSAEEYLIKDSQGDSWYIEVKEAPDAPGEWIGYIFDNKREQKATIPQPDRNRAIQAAVGILIRWWVERGLSFTPFVPDTNWVMETLKEATE